MKYFALLLLSLFIFSACVSPTPAPDPSVLRVGVTTDSPPLIFRQGGIISGAEADFARKVSQELGRELVFVEVPWTKQIEYLVNNKTDIIMSGMSVTPAREYRINFSKPYMTSGLTGLFRRTDYASAGLTPSVMRHQNSVIGVVKNTTGEIFAKNRYVNARINVYDNEEKAVNALKNEKVNMVIHDAPMIRWIAANHEAELVAFRQLLNNEPVAWGISKNNSGLLEEVNRILDQMNNDGSGVKILQTWFPES